MHYLHNILDLPVRAWVCTLRTVRDSSRVGMTTGSILKSTAVRKYSPVKLILIGIGTFVLLSIDFNQVTEHFYSVFQNATECIVL